MAPSAPAWRAHAVGAGEPVSGARRPDADRTAAARPAVRNTASSQKAPPRCWPLSAPATNATDWVRFRCGLRIALSGPKKCPIQ